MQTKRILMNEADGSPGNGAPAAPAAPPAPPAEPTAPAFDIESLVARIGKMVDEKIETKQNAAFAKLRKEGQLPGKEKPAPEPTATPSPTPTAAPSMADIQALLDRTAVLTRVQVENKLTDAQVRRMRSALETEKPEDPGAWAATYLADLGLVRSTESTPATPNPQPTPAPVSDKGSPAPGGVVNWERELAENPIGMSEAARKLMDAKYGPEEGRRKRLEAARWQAQRITVKATTP